MLIGWMSSGRRPLRSPRPKSGLDVYPENGIWETQQILSQTFYPD
ncbi:Hypothetical protein SMB2099_4012 [Serratia marcescens SMB2099]|nr:Hypothetical protein SMB2099_4012 [Serratia marcescens SMB2099]